MTIEAVFDKAVAFDCPLIEVTGGEPLLQAEVLPLMRRLADAGRTVALETSGAHDVGPVDPRVHIVMDVKCPDSGESDNTDWENFQRLKPSDEVKFVVASRDDFDFALQTVTRHDLDRKFGVLVSPVFGKVNATDLADWVLASGRQLRLQLQLHKLLWDPKARGV
jgi:7-carboxy-7-deazaguanine synthase